MLEFLIASFLSFSSFTPLTPPPPFIDNIVINISPLPKIHKKTDAPDNISAKSIFVVDKESNIPLLKKNSHKKLPHASLTKLMAALLILENHRPNERVFVPLEAAQVGGSQIYLRYQEEISVGELLKGLLVKSGNDAAIALAFHNAKNTDAFVKKMNLRAQALGMKNTHYTNPHGLDDKDHYSTSYDTAILTQALLKHPLFYKIIQKQDVRIYSLTEKERAFKSTNKLFSSSFLGGKTGTTEAALECLFLLHTSAGTEQIFIILGSYHRYDDAKALERALVL